MKRLIGCLVSAPSDLASPAISVKTPSRPSETETIRKQEATTCHRMLSPINSGKIEQSKTQIPTRIGVSVQASTPARICVPAFAADRVPCNKPTKPSTTLQIDLSDQSVFSILLQWCHPVSCIPREILDDRCQLHPLCRYLQLPILYFVP